MSKGKSERNLRQAIQLHTCRAVLSKYLQGAPLEEALLNLKDAMRKGPQSWAFKPKDVEPSDDRIYYTSGGASS